MKEEHHIAEPWPDNGVVAETRVREADVDLTPEAEAKSANRLPRTEQLNRFEKDLEAKDSGNQPA